ncbi:Kelch repeat-containing protein [Melittangium boletus]|uniref:TSP C-terminal domain-containing protein n=1 Tax=Melittangium boletus DSM 14713 TaxID=1294270 RepID=A0A250I9M5_9BACT|nr:Ig-like domain-containing protein [Melittangium boletus]ATB27666.1 hypothetical protein MEBOL_001110 [Melittangium boletus DSM 14713]
MRHLALLAVFMTACGNEPVASPQVVEADPRFLDQLLSDPPEYVSLVAPAASACGKSDTRINMAGWTPQSYAAIDGFGEGKWTLHSGGYGVKQTVNGQPTMFVSDFTTGGLTIIGRMKQSVDTDDDFFGFMIGYKRGDHRNKSADYLLVDWKQEDQYFGAPSNMPESHASKGIALSRVRGVPTAEEFWGHVDFDHPSSPKGQGVVELARGRTRGSKGWKRDVDYTFRFDIDRAGVRVFVTEPGGKETLELAHKGDYSDLLTGNFTFYNFSQANVDYTSFIRRPVCIPSVESIHESTRKNLAKSILLKGHDPEGEPLTYTIIRNPSHGTLTVYGSTVVYQPRTHFAGRDSFDYIATNATSHSAPATVTIDVLNTPPVAYGQSVSTRKNQPRIITLSGSDADGEPIAFQIVRNPSHGTLAQSGASVTYTPAPGFAGMDSFAFWSVDSTTHGEAATVNIEVINIPPVAYDQSVEVRKNKPKRITLVATDADGEALRYEIVSPPAHGALTQTGAEVVYTPTRGFAGKDAFTFRAVDSTTHGNTATVRLEVINTVPVARDQAVVMVKKTTQDFRLLAEDEDGDPLTYTLVTNPTQGTFVLAGNTLTYTPVTAPSPTYDAFTFKVSDGMADSNTAKVSIQIAHEAACLVAPGYWGPTGSLRGPRIEHRAAPLPGGKVLVSGDFNWTTEVYDPRSGRWSLGLDALASHRYHTATTLSDGTLLVAGGEGSEAGNFTELYDPALELWLPADPMRVAREYHTATLLQDGRVLVTGGRDTVSGVLWKSAELYDPSTQRWLPAASMGTARQYHTATLLLDGRVLVTGGETGPGTRTALAEIYDPSTDAWTEASAMIVARGYHTATSLKDGRVLITGGGDRHDNSDTAELFDPATGTWTATGRMLKARRYHSAIPFPDGKVFVVGGYSDGDGILYLAELFDPGTRTWSPAGCTSVSRWGATTSWLTGPDRVLVTAGVSTDGFQSTADLYYLAKP